MKSRLIVFVAFVGLALALAFFPQHRAQAKTCYDESKNVIPCPQSNYKQTQQAKKAEGPSATPVPPTDTPTSTPTDTPVPTATNTPTPQQSSALVAASACPSPAAAVANSSGQTPPPSPAGGFSFWPLLLGGGGLLSGILIGLLVGTNLIVPSMNRGKPGELLPAVNKVNGDGIVGPDRGWKKLDDWEDKWKKLDGAEDKWIKLDGTQDKWIKLDGAQDKWIKLDGTQDKWIKLDDMGIKWQKLDTSAGPSSSQEEAGAAVDMFHKGNDAGFEDLGLRTGQNAGFEDLGLRTGQNAGFEDLGLRNADANINGDGHTAAGPGSGPHIDSNMGDGSV